MREIMEGRRTPSRLRQAAFVAGMLLGVLPVLAASAKPADDVLTAAPEIERPYVVKGSSEPIYIYIGFKALDDEIADESRPPLDFGLVLDRSGSMSDAGKIDYLRQAAKMAVDRLKPSDALSIVEYDDQITVMVPAHKLRNVREIKRMIDALEPRGSTNLAGGLVRGIEEVEDYDGRSRDMLARVLLLSDGLANVGVTDPREIAELVREARRKGIRISALGLGRDYDEDLMQAIAESGGGRYYYVEHPSQLARVFEQELKTAFRTAARDIRIRLRCPDGVKVEILGYDEAAKTGDIALDLGDFYAGEERGLVLRVEADSSRLGRLDIGRLDVTYADASGGAERTIGQDLSVEVTDDADLAARSLNAKVHTEATLGEAEREQAAAVKAFEEGRLDEANAQLNALAGRLRTENESLNDDRIRNKIEALDVEQLQMTTAAASPEAAEDFVKSSKARLLDAKQGQRAGYMLQEGDEGLEVERLQQALKDAGFYQGAVDGKFSPATRQAVEAYQQSESLKVDGIAGPGTMNELGIY